MLLARRLVEAGVTFVTVHTETKGPGHWDTHENNFNLLEDFLLPFLDRALTSLLEDLAERGLLETTLVVVTGDMGRTPRVNGKAGRDHWPQYPSILALLASPSPMRSWAPSAVSPVPLARQPTARGFLVVSPGGVRYISSPSWTVFARPVSRSRSTGSVTLNALTLSVSCSSDNTRELEFSPVSGFCGGTWRSGSACL